MFDINLKGSFELFSYMHVIPTTITLLLIGLIIMKRDYLKTHINWLPKALAILTLFQHFSLFFYRIYFDLWSISQSLPLQLCSLAVYFSAYTLWTKDKRFFNSTFFVMFIGALFAIIAPEITDNLGYPHFRYFQFFTSHALILINLTYALFVYEYATEFQYKDVLKNVLFILLFAGVALIINLLTGGNYLYLMHSPGTKSALELLGRYPFYIPNMLLVVMPIMFHISYIPFYIYHKNRET